MVFFLSKKKCDGAKLKYHALNIQLSLQIKKEIF